MKYSILGAGLLSISLLTGCNLNDLSNTEAVKSDTTKSAVSLTLKHGLVGNQLIQKQGNHWIKSQTLNAQNSGWSGETVSITNKHAIIADAFNNRVKIFSLNNDSQEWEESASLYEPSLYGYGESVYIDNNVAFIGAPNSNLVISYKNMHGYWQEQERVTPNLVDTAYFGGSVDYQNGYLFVGAKSIDKVFIYKKEDSGFELVQTIDHFDPELLGGKQFGWSLDAHNDQLAIAAYQDWSNTEQSAQGGKVHIYQKKGTYWELTQSVTAFELNDDNGEITHIDGNYFGHNLALNDTNLMVGDDGMQEIYQYKKSEDNLWQAIRVIKPMQDRQDGYGYFLDINNDYLLTGGVNPTLFGPQIPKATIEGRVVDANGFPISRANISGFLDDISTNETGNFTSQQAISWQGSILANSGINLSNDIVIDTLIEDTVLNDIQLDFVPEHIIVGSISGIPRSSIIEIFVTNQVEPILTRSGRFNFRLANGWQGDVRPTSDIYQFIPPSIAIDGLSDYKTLSFQASPKE